MSIICQRLSAIDDERYLTRLVANLTLGFSPSRHLKTQKVANIYMSMYGSLISNNINLDSVL